MSRTNIAWAAGSLLVWLTLALIIMMSFGNINLANVKFSRGYLLVAAVHGLILHFLLFAYAKPRTLGTAIQSGVFIGFAALVLYFLTLLLVGKTAVGLRLYTIAAYCSYQLVLIFGGLPYFLLQTLVGGSTAGFARWKALDNAAI